MTGCDQHLTKKLGVIPAAGWIYGQQVALISICVLPEENKVQVFSFLTGCGFGAVRDGGHSSWAPEPSAESQSLQADFADS